MKQTRDQAIGLNVARYRGDRSQQWLADRMRERGYKWSQATVWAVEKGERPLRLSEAEDLSFLLRIAPILLMRGRMEGDLAELAVAISTSSRDMYDVMSRHAEVLARVVDMDAKLDALDPVELEALRKSSYAYSVYTEARDSGLKAFDEKRDVWGRYAATESLSDHRG